MVYYMDRSGPLNYGRTGQDQPLDTLRVSDELGKQDPLVGVRSGEEHIM